MAWAFDFEFCIAITPATNVALIGHRKDASSRYLEMFAQSALMRGPKLAACPRAIPAVELPPVKGGDDAEHEQWIPTSEAMRRGERAGASVSKRRHQAAVDAAGKVRAPWH